MIQIHVGIDVYMSRQDAEALIAQSGSAFSAAMWGDDEWYDNWQTNLNLTWEAAWDGGHLSRVRRAGPSGAPR